MRFPKSPSTHNQAFRDLARGQDCTMNVLGVCNYDSETVVLAHSNSMADGKGKGYKANDHSGVWACHACHAWLDQGKASKAEKDAAFEAAQLRMIYKLAEIASSPTLRPSSVAAARWAIQQMAEEDQAR
jgi:Protein of unknown function (DUF1364)